MGFCKYFQKNSWLKFSSKDQNYGQTLEVKKVVQKTTKLVLFGKGKCKGFKK